MPAGACTSHPNALRSLSQLHDLKPVPLRKVNGDQSPHWIPINKVVHLQRTDGRDQIKTINGRGTPYRAACWSVSKYNIQSV